jgi:5-methylcytosine-specific restriction protein B
MKAYSNECLEVLDLLKARKNVLLMGAPGCGKTLLMSEVADAFKNGFVTIGSPAVPTHVGGSAVTIPRSIPTSAGTTPIAQMPSPDRTNREVFRTVFSANSKPRDFLTGLVPKIDSSASGLGFKVAQGKLVVANNYAQEPKGAALLVIDELNRGPAVQLFGDAIVAIEADKRMADDDSIPFKAFPFDVLDPATGAQTPTYLSAHLYILAAMNQADVSVEPLDVAFIRRWERYMLSPEPEKVRAKLASSGASVTLPDVPTSPGDVVEAAIRAWESVNQRIALGRGAEFQLGHGVFFSRANVAMASMAEALCLAVSCWAAITAHLDEVFFGDAFGIAATLRADLSEGHYRLESVPFGQEQRQMLRSPGTIDSSNIYQLLCWVGRS